VQKVDPSADAWLGVAQDDVGGWTRGLGGC